MTRAATPSLFDAFACEKPLVLWHRRRRGAKWLPLFAGFTESECTAAMHAHRESGAYLTLPADEHPDRRRRK